MKVLKILSCVALLTLGACASYEWGPEEVNGISLIQATAECNAEAQKNVRDMRTTGSWYAFDEMEIEGPLTLEKSEAERCLSRKGFHKARVD